MQMQRVRDGVARRVPRLKREYIERDAWTKLNVVPAKILQQPAVLAELFEHSEPEGKKPPQDAKTTKETREYLMALNDLFERGFLSSNFITRENRKVLANIDRGYGYFVNWIDSLIDRQDFSATDSKERRFIAWQTWDLLRFCVYGLKDFCEDFFSRHPTYYIIPVRINGSAIESLFSQFKFSSGSKLSSVNYASATRAFKLKRTIHGTFAAARGQLDRPLYVQESVLRKLKK